MNIAALTEKVSSYQLSMIKISKEESSPASFDDNSQDRYQRWQLPDLIRECGLRQDQSITTWIGFEPNSHIYAILFCLLQGCLKQSSREKNYFLKLKYNLYGLAKKSLLLRQQKCLVEMLSFVEYSTDITKVLAKYHHLERVFASIFEKTIHELKGTQECKMQQMKLFCRKIPFCSFLLVQQNLACLIIDDSRYHVILHRSCYFVVEYSDEKDRQYTENQITFLDKCNRVKTNSNDLEEETYAGLYTNSNRIKTSSSKDKIYTPNSSSKKLQYSTPKFIMRSIHTSNKNASGGSERQANEIKVKSFDFSGEKEKGLRGSEKKQVFSSFKKESKFIPSIQKIIEEKRFKNPGSKRLGSFPISPKKEEQGNSRNGFVFRSLGSDNSGANTEKEIKKGIFDNIKLKENKKLTNNRQNVDKSDQKVKVDQRNSNESASLQNFISTNIVHSQIHLSPKNTTNTQKMIGDANLHKIFRNTKNLPSIKEINNPERSISPFQSRKSAMKPNKITFTYLPTSPAIREFRSLSPHQIY